MALANEQTIALEALVKRRRQLVEMLAVDENWQLGPQRFYTVGQKDLFPRILYRLRRFRVPRPRPIRSVSKAD
jgi:hypothetical protein